MRYWLFHLFMDSEPDFWLHLHNIHCPLCGHHDLFLAVRNCLHLFQRQAYIVKQFVVIIQLLWGQKWIMVVCCGTFLFALIIKFKLFSTIVTDVELILGRSLRGTSTQYRSYVGLTMHGWYGPKVGPTSAQHIFPCSFFSPHNLLELLCAKIVPMLEAAISSGPVLAW